MEYYLAKQDLERYRDRDFHTLRRYYGIPSGPSHNDMLWELAIRIHSTKWNSQRAFFKGLDMTKFTLVLGGGGFGTVYGQKDNNIVGKFLLNPENCDDAQVEFKKHKVVYDAFQTANNLGGNKQYPHLCISKPLDFTSELATVMGKNYLCGYIMTRLLPFDQNGLYHIIHNENNPQVVNRIVARFYGEPVSDDNPSRGFFATYDYLTENILDNDSALPDIPTLLRYMGYALGVMIFIAELYPRDVEFVLGRNEQGEPCFTVLDFGLTKQIDFDDNEDIIAGWANKIVNDILDIDIYFPTTTTNIEEVKKGITDAFQLTAEQEPKKKLVYDMIMENWN